MENGNINESLRYLEIILQNQFSQLSSKFIVNLQMALEQVMQNEIIFEMQLKVGELSCTGKT